MSRAARARLGMWGTCLLLATATSLWACPVAGAQRQSRAYRTTIRDAVGEFSAGRWEEARALFQRAHDLDPSARTLRGIGMAAFEMRDYVGAYRALSGALESTRRRLDRRQRTEVGDLLVRTRAFLGRFRIVVEPQGARVTVDLRPPELEADGHVLIGVGQHTISATREGYRPASHSLAVHGGEEEEVRIALQAEVAEPHPRQVAGTSDGGGLDPVGLVLLTASAALVTGTIGGAIWMADRADAVDACAHPPEGSRCTNADTVGGEHGLSILVTVGAAVAAVATGALGAWLLVSGSGSEGDGAADADERPREPDGARAGPRGGGPGSAAVACAPGLLGLACGGRF